MSDPTPKKLAISRDEIRAIYVEGEDAIIALVERLLQQIVVLEEWVKALENQLAKNSRNSSKATSAKESTHSLE